jgi:nitrate reductase NapAB chaperone NapD
VFEACPNNEKCKNKSWIRLQAFTADTLKSSWVIGCVNVELKKLKTNISQISSVSVIRVNMVTHQADPQTDIANVVFNAKLSQPFP